MIKPEESPLVPPVGPQAESKRIMSPEQATMLYLRLPSTVEKRLVGEGFFDNLTNVIEPLYREWDILGSRYEAMLDIFFDRESEFDRYPLFEDAKKLLQDLRQKKLTKNAEEFKAYIERVVDEVRDELTSPFSQRVDIRTDEVIFKCALTLYISESPNIRPRSEENIRMGSDLMRQAFYKRFEANRGEMMAGFRMMTEQAMAARRAKSQRVVETVFPIIEELSSQGWNYDQIADKLNSLGHKTSKGNNFTRESLDGLMFRLKKKVGSENIGKRYKKVRDEVLPIIERMSKEGKWYPDIAKALNEAGYRTAQGKEFNQNSVGYLVNTSEILSPLELVFSRQERAKAAIYRLMDKLPLASQEYTEKAIQRIKQWKEVLGNKQFVEEFADHPNYSYTFDLIRWNVPVFELIQVLVKEQLLEWQRDKSEEAKEPTPKVETMGEIVLALIKAHPDNGLVSQEDIFQKIADIVAPYFAVIHHPYGKMLTALTVEGFLKREEKVDVIIRPEIRKQQYYRPAGTGKSIPVAEIQALLDQNKTRDDVAAELSKKHDITIKASTMHPLYTKGVLTYPLQESKEKKWKEEDDAVLEGIKVIEQKRTELQKILAETPFDHLTEEQRARFDEVMEFPLQIRSKEQIYQRMSVRMGSGVKALQLAMEEGMLPKNNLAILVGDRFRSDTYFHLDEIAWKRIGEEFGISPKFVTVQGKPEEERIGIMNTGEFSDQMAKRILREARESKYIFPNHGEFYQMLSDRLQHAFILGAHPFAPIVNKTGLFVGYQDSEIHESILTATTIWQKPLFVVEGKELTLNDIIGEVVSDHLQSGTWPQSNAEKSQLVYKRIHEVGEVAEKVLDPDVTAEVIVRILQHNEEKLHTKMKAVKKLLSGADSAE